MRKILLFIFILSSTIGSYAQEITIKDLLKSQEEFDFVPIGLCEDYPEETTNLEIIKKDFEFLKQHDVKLLRISFGWDAIEAEKDQYDWLFWDEFVQMAVEDYDLLLIPYICYTPSWAVDSGADRTWNKPPKDYDQFEEFMFDLVSRYKKYIKSWELWNEPNLPIYWQGSEAEFAELIRVGSAAVKKADPEAVVVLGGMAASRPGFFHNLFRYHNVSEYVDVVNLHNYYETWQFHPVEKIVDLISEYIYTIELFGNDQSLWIAEVGYSTFRDQRKISDAYYATYDYEHTPEYQAVDLAKRIMLILSTGKVEAIAWYEIKDLPKEEEVIGDEYNNRYLGIAYPDHTPKPAAQTIKFLNDLFDKKIKPYDDEIYVTKKAGSEAVVKSFITEEGNIILAAWLQTNDLLKNNSSLKNKSLLKDEREENINIKIPKKISSAVLYDEFGNPESFDEIVENGSDSMIPSFKLHGGKIKIIEMRSAE